MKRIRTRLKAFVAASAGATLLALGTAIPSNAETSNPSDVCEVVEEVKWTAKSKIAPGSNAVHEPKVATLNGDVAIDGWWQNHSPIAGKGEAVTRASLTAQQLAGVSVGEFGQGAMRTSRPITELMA